MINKSTSDPSLVEAIFLTNIIEKNIIATYHVIFNLFQNNNSLDNYYNVNLLISGFLKSKYSDSIEQIKIHSSRIGCKFELKNDLLINIGNVLLTILVNIDEIYNINKDVIYSKDNKQYDNIMILLNNYVDDINFKEAFNDDMKYLFEMVLSSDNDAKIFWSTVNK
jgi:hypothetical protein